MPNAQGQGTNNAGGNGVHWNRDALIGLVSLLVIAVIIFLGVSLTHGNSDYVCSAQVNDSQQGACTDGSWGAWTEVNGVAERTYTGEVSTVSFAGKVTGVSCSHPSYSASQANGTVTTQYNACQIVETGSSASGETGDNDDGNGNANGTDLNDLSNVNETVSTGAVTNSSSITGSYTDYENYMNSTLATSSIEVVPTLVKPGETTQVIWTSSHVNSCVVTASNNDTWTELQSPLQGETSSPINQQTTYTLTCVNPLGAQMPVQEATVGIVPQFQEQ